MRINWRLGANYSTNYVRSPKFGRLIYDLIAKCIDQPTFNECMEINRQSKSFER